MTDLSVNYLGLELKNPIIIGSSSLTATVGRIDRCADAGAGAIVVKSLFEEQIMAEIAKVEENVDVFFDHPEAFDYVRNMGSGLKIGDYSHLIEDARNVSGVPIIASINCVSANQWVTFARELENSGASAIELNMAILPWKIKDTDEGIINRYIDIVSGVRAATKLPIAVKIGPFFTSLPTIVDKLVAAGANSIVLFNRFYQPDVNLDKIELHARNNFSRPDDVAYSLRWVGLLSGNPKYEVCSSTGIHNGAGALKHLLVGANAVQVCSALYLNGVDHIQTILEEMRTWMKEHNFTKIDDFRGKLSFNNVETPSDYERIQYIKALVGID